MFGRQKTPPEPAAPSAGEPSSVGKGHATPTRKQAEAANRRPLVPVDRKAAAKDSRAAARARRDLEYRAMQSGDEKNMPAQHRGPVRRYVRDYVDARRSWGQYFLPVVLVLLVAGMLATGPLSKIGSGAVVGVYLVLMLPYVYLLGSAVDTFLLWRSLKRRLAEKFGPELSLRGLLGYALLRVYQLRRLRAPKPQVAVGAFPR